MLLCPMQQVGLSVNPGRPMDNRGCKQQSEKMSVWCSNRVTRASERAVMGKCSGVSLVTLEIKGDSLTLLVQFFKSKRPLGDVFLPLGWGGGDSVCAFHSPFNKDFREIEGNSPLCVPSNSGCPYLQRASTTEHHSSRSIMLM